MRKAEAKEFYIAGTVWNMWADYWTTKSQLIPPLHYLRVGGGEDFIFVSAVPVKDLDDFVEAVKAAAELAIKREGDWWLRSHIWFGHWTVFSATVRQAFMGVERQIWGGENAYDFDGSGDSRLIPLRPAGEDASQRAVELAASEELAGEGRA